MKEKKSARGISLILVATLVVSVTGGIWWSGKQNISYAKEVFYDTEKMVQENISAGSAFTVLEIVPTLEDARMGYLVGGSEPDLYSEGIADTLRAEGLLTDDANSTAAYPMTCLGVDVVESETLRPDLVELGYKETEVTTVVSGGDATNGDVSGGDISGGDVSGGDVSGGNVSGSDVSGNDITVTTYVYERDIIRNNEFFKKYILGMEASYDRLSVNVVTKTPTELTQADIDSANLIYISGRNAVGYLQSDFTADVAKGLVNSITNEKIRKPAIVDYNLVTQIEGAVTDDWAGTNLYKVCLVLLGEEPGKIYATIADKWNETIYSEAWKPVINAKTVINSGHFVRENVYWYTYRTSEYENAKGVAGQTYYFVNNDLAAHFTSSAIGYGFAMVVSAIDAENYNNSINNPNRESMNTGHVTQALVTQYILQYDTNEVIIYKDEIKILELQPCKDYNFQSAEGKQELIKNWLPAFSEKPDKVEVTCMTVAELIGHNENLSDNYDLIYIGSNTGMYNTKTVRVKLGGVEENRTYKMANDNLMNGLVYSHVGDTGNLTDWGLIKTDSSANNKTQYRFPGTDLTTYKLEELMEFLNCGSPIIVADDFFTYNTDGSITPNGNPVAINGGKAVYTANNKNIYGILDTSSYMYQLVVYAVHGKDATAGADINNSATWTIDWNKRAFRNFFYESAVNEDNLAASVNQQKLYLNLTTRPTEYSYSTTGTYHYINDVTSLAPAADGKYYLTYEFSISSLGVVAANQTYDLQLFIDVNNDGKSSRTQEEMDTLTVTNIATGATVNRGSNGYQLNAGVAYRMTRALPADYFGCIAWELVCTANNNKDIYASQRGYTVVQDPTGNKTQLDILQITSGYSTSDAGGWATGGGWTINDNNLNLEQELRNGTSAWGQLLNNVPDFKLNITTVSTYGNDGLIARFAANPDYLDNFDMLIFGFGDGYSDIRYAPLLTAIEEYANSGHCILFAHDTTWTETGQLPSYYSYTTANNQQQTWLETTGNTRYFADGQGWIEGFNDQRSRYLTQVVRKISGMDAYGITANGAARNGTSISKGTAEWNELKASGKDIAFMPNTYQTKTVANTQGANYTQLQKNLINNTNMVFAYDVSDRFFKEIHTYPYEPLRYAPSVVQKINDGIITNYPYKIPDSFEVATTHNQYWALDLESDKDDDGESDLVVWYTMNDITIGDNGTFKDDLCSVSPNDARNNYYIYNMGNITYTGVGHTAVSNEQEVKLFINTMVASYIASIKNPGVRIVEDGTKHAADITNISVPLLDDGTLLTEHGGDSTVRVYFEVSDNNIVKGTRKITGNFYVGGTAIKLSIYDVKGNKLYDAASTAEANVLTSGNTYYVDIPTSAIAGMGAVDFTVEVYSDWKRNGVNIQSDKVSDDVRISKVQLFDLD